MSQNPREDVVKVTQEFAEFASQCRFEDLPKQVVGKTKGCLLDLLGCALAGARTETARILLSFVRDVGGKPESTLWKHGDVVPSFWAAFYNGTISHALELDDGHTTAHTHPGVTVIPAAIAVAESIKGNGRDLIASMAVGYELNVRLGEAISPSAIYSRGFHTPALVGSFSAAAAASRMLQLDERQLANALGIASLGPVGVMETFERGAMTKDAYGGWPAAVGTLAAMLAGKGFTGADTILEGEFGFCRVVSNEKKVDELLKGLGEDWKMLTTYRKRHAMCSHGHTAMDAGLEILNKYNPRLDEVDKILVRTYEFAARMNEKDPHTDVKAKFSIPYCLAVELKKGRPVGPSDFTEGMLEDKEVHDLSNKIEVVLDREVDRFHKCHEQLRRSIIEVLMDDGRRYTSCVDVAKGSPPKEFTQEEIEAKFKVLSSGCVTPAQDIIEIIALLEEQEDVGSVIELLA